MIDFKNVLENANEKFKFYLVHVARTPYSNPKVSGEVEAMGKAIIEAVNNQLAEYRKVLIEGHDTDAFYDLENEENEDV